MHYVLLTVCLKGKLKEYRHILLDITRVHGLLGPLIQISPPIQNGKMQRLQCWGMVNYM